MICDFGLAKVCGVGKTDLTTIEFNCTLRYSRPDAEEDGCATNASDVWAWGCLLLYVSVLTSPSQPLFSLKSQIMTNKYPYHTARSDIDIVKALVEERPPANLDLVDAPADTKATMGRCWNFAPEERPPMATCRDDLAKVEVVLP